MAYGQYTSLTDLSQPMDVRNLNDMLAWLFRTLQGNVGDAEVNTLTFNKLIGGILALGGVDNGNGEFTLKDASGNVIAEGNKDGISVNLPEREPGSGAAPFVIIDKQFNKLLMAITTYFEAGGDLQAAAALFGTLLVSDKDGNTVSLDPAAKSVGIGSFYLQLVDGVLKADGSKVWTEATDGHGSTLDADTVDGKHISDVGTWTPTFTGFSTAPTGGLYRYREIGNVCECWVRMPNNGTSNASNFYMSLPFPPANVSGMTWGSTDVVAVDNGTTQTTPGRVTVSGGGTVAVFSKDAAGGAWTNTGNKRVEFAHFTYEKA